jgi:hypothetical protein
VWIERERGRRTKEGILSHTNGREMRRKRERKRESKREGEKERERERKET